MRALIAVLVLPMVVGSATARHDHAVSEPDVGEPCPHPRYIRFEDGGSLEEVRGRLVGRDDKGLEQVIHAPRVILASRREIPDAKPKKLEVNNDGTFSVVLWLDWSRVVKCSDGKLIASEQITPEAYAFRAKGCDDTVVTVGPDWVPRDIELRCTK